MKKGKFITISIMSILMALMAVVIISYFVIVFAGQTKEVVNTFNVGLISTNDETGNEQYVVSAKYYSNENKNGYECLDIKFNAFTDENGNMIHSKGIQIITNTTDKSIETVKGYLTKSVKSEWIGLFRREYFERTAEVFFNDASIFYYQSGDDFEHDITGIKKNDFPTTYTIKLDNEFYRFSFRGVKLTGNKDGENIDEDIWYGRNEKYYTDYNINYFIESMLTSIKQSTNKTTATSLFKFADMFIWEKWDGKNYNPIGEEEMSKLKQTKENFFAVQYQRSADGLRKSTDSLFKMANGSAQLNLTDDNLSNDYLYGRTVVVANNDAFDYGKVNDNFIVLKLKESFIKKFESQKAKIVLSVQIDLDAIGNDGYCFIGFAEISGLEKFEILECYKYETVLGEIIKSEVVV